MTSALSVFVPPSQRSTVRVLTSKTRAIDSREKPRAERSPRMFGRLSSIVIGRSPCQCPVMYRHVSVHRMTRRRLCVKAAFAVGLVRGRPPELTRWAWRQNGRPGAGAKASSLMRRLAIPASPRLVVDGSPRGWGRSPVRSDGLRGGGVEQGGFTVVRPGTGNRRGYWTRDVPSVPSEVRKGDFGGQLNSGRALARRQARSTSSWFTHSSFLL